MKLRHLATCFLMLVAGCADAQTPQKPQAYVTDSTNQIIGLLEQQGMLLIQTSGSNVVSVPVSSTGFQSTDNPLYFYLTNDCTGAKYIRADFVPANGFITQSGRFLIYPDVDNLSSQTFQSYSTPRCFKNVSLIVIAGQAKALDLAGRNYTPPFKAVLR